MVRTILKAVNAPVPCGKAIVDTITAFSFDRTDAFYFYREADPPAVSAPAALPPSSSSSATAYDQPLLPVPPPVV